MNPLTDTLDTLLPEARSLIRSVMEGAQDNFTRDGHLLPAAFSVTAEGQGEVIGTTELSDETKPGVWAMVRELRATRPIVAFISEVWMAKCEPGDVNPDGSVKVMPRNHPRKTEHALLVLWEGPRNLAFTATITRNPTHLGDWEVMFDSDFPTKNITSLGGGMMAGESYPLKES